MRSLLPVILLAAACGTTTRFIATNPSPRPMAPRAPESVALFTTGHPNVPYVEVGIIQGRQSSSLSFDEMPGIIAAIREDAAKAGCDAIIINGASDKVVGDRSGTDTLEGFWGACVMYMQPMSAAVTAPPQS
ncbi:MAG TPA: hypothetical protein VL463_16310 [Kofleriaceae bacterium]|nr:hypothetical protein [Kofleriaceae bacterium]